MVLMIQETNAGVKKFGLVFDSSDLVFEVGMMPLGDIDEIFFHFLHVPVFYEFGDLMCRLIVELRDVFENHSPGDLRDFLFRCRATELLKNPRITDRSTAYHEPGGSG